ncbi:hypothetical protein V8C40DRAFT_245344 [Trichoderma camerunense]
MLMPATSPWFPRDPTSFVSPYAVEPWLRYVSPVLLVEGINLAASIQTSAFFEHQTNTAPMSRFGDSAIIACLLALSN